MKAKAHKKITAKVVDIFKQHRQSSFGEKLDTYGGDIVEGSVEADIFPIFERATNWHFYKENELLKATKIGLVMVHPTSDYILGKRINQLHDHISNAKNATSSYVKDNELEDAFELTGRALHHIQDMSTPSHITPIYHGPDFPFNQVDGALIVPDHFENFSAERKVIIPLLEAIDISKNEFDQIENEADISLSGLYDDAAKRSLNSLFDDPASNFIEGVVNDNPSPVPLSMFWQKHSLNPAGGKIAGFGSFGPLEKAFDNPDEVVLDDDGNSYHFQTNALENFCSLLLNKMVRDSIRGLFIVEKMMQEVD
ncbi:MAG: hypothetical protein R8K54_04145 [Mariprofundaceae bacterium]